MQTEVSTTSQDAQAVTITIEDVAQTFGPVCAKLAREHNQWPDSTEVIYRLGLIAKYGKRRLRGILAARRRYEARARAEQFREAGFGNGRAA